MNQEEAQKFAEEWAAAWNSHDLARILSHYTDDFVMTSPIVQKYMGVENGTLEGKDAVGMYWGIALGRYPNLKFEILHVTSGVDTVSICYKAIMDSIAIETFFFDRQGKVRKAIATYS